MKKNILTLSSIAFAALAMSVGCTRAELEGPQPDSQDEGIPFSLIASTVDTRTSMDGYQSSWTSGDGLTVWHENTDSVGVYYKEAKFTANTSGTVVEFSGSVNDSLAGDSYNWYAIYPWKPALLSPKGDAAGFKGTHNVGNHFQDQAAFSSTAHISGNENALVAVAKDVVAADTPELQFKPLFSMVKVHVTNNSGKRLYVNYIKVWTDEEGETLSGQHAIDFTATPPTFTAKPNESYSECVLNVKGGQNLADGESADFYMSVKPCTLGSGSNLFVNVNGVEKGYNLDKDYSFTAGKVKTVNYSYTDTETFNGRYLIAGEASDGNLYIAEGYSFPVKAIETTATGNNPVLFSQKITPCAVTDPSKTSAYLYDTKLSHTEADDTLGITIDDYIFTITKVSDPSSCYVGLYTIRNNNGAYMAATSSSANYTEFKAEPDSNCYWAIDGIKDGSNICAAASGSRRHFRFNENNMNLPRFICTDYSNTAPRAWLIPSDDVQLIADPLPRLSVEDCSASEAAATDVKDASLITVENNETNGWILSLVPDGTVVTAASYANDTLTYSISANAGTTARTGKIFVTLTDPSSTYDPVRDTVYVTQAYPMVICLGGCGSASGICDEGNHMTNLGQIDYDFNAADYNDNNNNATNDNAKTSPGADRMYKSTDFNYEMFAQIVAGEKFYFYTGEKLDKDKILVPTSDGKSLVEIDESEIDTKAQPVSATGVYRIRYSSITGEYICQIISEVTCRFWKASSVKPVVNDQSLVYKGNGVWSLNTTAYGAQIIQRGYKFLFKGLPNDQPYGFMNIDHSCNYDLTKKLTELDEDFWKVCPVRGGTPPDATAKVPATKAQNGAWPVVNELRAQFSLGNKQKGITVNLYMNDTYGAYTHRISVNE